MVETERKRRLGRISQTAFAGRACLIFLVSVGAYLALATSRDLASVRSDYDTLKKLIGDHPIEESEKVWITPIAHDEPLEWGFRCYLPAKYSAVNVRSFGLISARGPRRERASTSSGVAGARNEPTTFMTTIAFFKEDGRWSVHTNHYSSRSRSSVPRELAELLDNPESLVVDVAGIDQQSYSNDQPICLLRVRARDPAADQDTSDPLYYGFHMYMVPQAAFEQFKTAQQVAPKRK